MAEQDQSQLEHLIAKITDGNLHAEVDMDKAVGLESDAALFNTDTEFHLAKSPTKTSTRSR